MSTYIIAEAGVNHNGSLEMAKELVLVAKEARADAVKFQTFKTENLVTKAAKQATYQIENLRQVTSQYSMLKQLELSYEEFVELQQFCIEQQIEFLSTPFDFESVDFLLDTLNIRVAKISSGELTNVPFVHYIATKRKLMILSTGMSTIEEIHEALAFIAYGLARPQEPVVLERVYAFYVTEEAKQVLKKYVTLLHCTTEYPASPQTINLRAMYTIGKEFGLPIGFSDHSEGTHIPVSAVALGAKVIEKHFTLDKTLEGPDHKASLEPSELNQMIREIREIELALGDGEKRPSAIELQNRIPSRKSLVSACNIAKGEKFTVHNLTMKRPGIGIAPSKFWEYIGKSATRDYCEGELIDE